MLPKPLFFLQEQLANEEYPVFDISISKKLLSQVNKNEITSLLRIYTNNKQIAFGPSDIRNPGYKNAVKIAKENNFQVVNRLTGGHAVAFHGGTLSFAFMIHDKEAKLKMHYYFQLISTILKSSMESMGINCYIDELMGEYCPGQYSINIEKKIKIIGIAQRIMSNAMYIGGFISVNNELVIKKILVPIYHSLGIDWDIKTAGSIANYIPDINHDIVINAIKNEIGKDTSIIDFTMNDNLINDARIDQATYIS